LDSVKGLLNSTYDEYCKAHSRVFDTFGHIYPNELVFTVSFFNMNHATTCILSCDIDKKTNHTKLLDALIDVIGVMFDHIFAEKEWSDFTPFWQELDHKGQKIHYQITRENIHLTIEATKLLSENN